MTRAVLLLLLLAKPLLLVLPFVPSAKKARLGTWLRGDRPAWRVCRMKEEAPAANERTVALQRACTGHKLGCDFVYTACVLERQIEPAKQQRKYACYILQEEGLLAARSHAFTGSTNDNRNPTRHISVHCALHGSLSCKGEAAQRWLQQR